MSNTIPIPQPDAYEYLIADVWRTQTHWNGVKASAYRCLYATEKVHAHAAAVSAADNAALRSARIAYANEFPLNSDGDPDVGNIHANIRAMKERIKVLEGALRHVNKCLSINDYGDYVLLSLFDAEIVRTALGDKT